MIIIWSVLLIFNTTIHAIVLRNRNRNIAALQNALRIAIDEIDSLNGTVNNLNCEIKNCNITSMLYAKKLKQIYDICQDKEMIANDLRRHIGLIADPAYLDFDEDNRTATFMTPKGPTTFHIGNS